MREIYPFEIFRKFKSRSIHPPCFFLLKQECAYVSALSDNIYLEIFIFYYLLTLGQNFKKPLAYFSPRQFNTLLHKKCLIAPIRNWQDSAFERHLPFASGHAEVLYYQRSNEAFVRSGQGAYKIVKAAYIIF